MSKRNSKNKGKESVSHSKEMNSFNNSDSDDEIDTNAEKSNYVGEDDESSDSNNVSDISDDSDFEEGDDNDDNSKKLGTKFLENVIKYLQVDDTIKEIQSELGEKIKNLKDTKGELEGYILRYLDRKGKDHIDVKDKCKLIKETKDNKSAIKPENIREGILEGLKDAKLIEQEAETLKLINNIMDSIDNKRAITKRTILRRVTQKKPKKSKKVKGKGKESKK
jgi:hypothetical protein